VTTTIGHYQIVAELGRGGMGVVYKGYEAPLSRYVAIKMLSPALAHDESIKERFLREARSMAALNDPHIIQIYFIGEHDGQPYFAMEFVEGESLSSYLKREGRLTPEQAARAIYQTALGLATAHDKGVVHRDIKPANLMLDARGRIKIADFGIALSSTEFSKKLTSTGEFVGTPGYLSPEVCTGKTVDLRSDIFSLGIVLFELLTGRMPFTDESPLGLMLEVVRAEIPDVRQLNADVDAALTAILQKMTAKDPAQRYASCHELVADLARHPLVAGAQTVTARPVISTVAQTVVGMKTPTPLPQIRPSMSASAATLATPAPVHATERMAPPPAEPPPAARPSVLERQDAPRRSNHGALWAIAAVLALGVLGGGAWAMRDKLGFQKGSETGTTKLVQLTATTSPAPATTTDATAATAVAPATAPTSSASTTPVAATIDGANQAAVQAVDAAAQAVAQATQLADAASNVAREGIAGVDEALRETDPAAAGLDESLAPLRRLALARGQQQDRQLAAAPPPERPAQPRVSGPPRIAIIALGDPALSGSAKAVLEDRLTGDGYLVVDDELVPGLQGAARRGMPDVFRVLAGAHGVRAVAVIRAEPIGTTQLNYYGQSDTMYSANLTVRTYDVHNRAPLSGNMRAKVDFTALNADYKAREALEPELNRLSSSLSAFRPRGGG
jgi:serine/threonine-protein kinase